MHFYIYIYILGHLSNSPSTPGRNECYTTLRSSSTGDLPGYHVKPLPTWRSPLLTRPTPIYFLVTVLVSGIAKGWRCIDYGRPLSPVLLTQVATCVCVYAVDRLGPWWLLRMSTLSII